ncbi:MAG TPA: LamG domain-containing protein [Verrucomicrobiae bacterium]|nr:LamG domain-containing protein [Verrucomicrobiae bacterium]
MPPLWTFPTSLDSWSFPDLTNWTSDNGYAPVSFTNLSSLQCGDISTKYALVLDMTNVIPARLQYRVVETNGATNLTLGLGAVSFWFAPHSWASASTNGTGPGAWAELLSVGQWKTNASYGYWGLSVDPGGTNIYFASQNSTGSNVAYLSAPVTWNTNEWHFIAMSYSATNTALYLDGELITTGSGVSVLPPTNVLANGFSVGSDAAGLAQSRGMFDDIYSFDHPLDSSDVENIYGDQYYEFFLNPYNYNYSDNIYTNEFGTNLSIYIPSISNNLASLLVANSGPDVLYEIQGKTNLLQTNWISEGFVYGSELTNWTAATIAANGGNLFLRTRSWQDSTGTGIPDWWWLQYFGQITNIDSAASLAGDGFNNLQKFRMGLNPTNYYNTNPPSGFFGAVMQITNAFLSWSPSPGPVASYLIKRGIFNFDSGNYSFTSFIVNSNATLFEDMGVITNNNAQNNKYTLQAVYPDGTTTAPDSWYVWQFGYYDVPPYAPPMATNVWANPDATGTNLLISWTPATGLLTNYIIERGILNPTNGNYDYSPISVVSTNTNSVEILNEFTNTARWNDVYGVVAAYAGSVLSKPAVSTIEAGSLSGSSAPTNFSGYLDSTGTNAYLVWNNVTSATGYIVYRGVQNFAVGGYGYTQVAVVGAGTNAFEIADADDAAHDHSSDVYTVVAVYSGGALSRAASPWHVSTGSAAPATLYAYTDSTGTNVILAWSAGANGTTGYVLSRSSDGGSSYSQIASVSSNAMTYEHTNGAPSGVSSLVYKIQSTYPHGGQSASAFAWVASTPPPPTALSVTLDSTGTNMMLSWQVALGPVSGYTIKRGTYDLASGTYSYTQVGVVSSGTTSFEDVGAFSGGNDNNDQYEVIANDAGDQMSLPDFGNLNFSAPDQNSNISITGALIRNEQGRWELMFSAISTNVQTIAFSWYMYDYWYDELFDPGQGYSTTTYIPVSSITNGVQPLSDAMMTNWFGNNAYGKVAVLQPIGAGNTFGALFEAGYESYDSPIFADARQHMKQNLLHEIRSATLTQRNISLSEDNVWVNPDWESLNVPPTDTNYVESSFFHPSEMVKGYGGNMTPFYLKMDNVWPIVANYQLHQQLYDTNYTGPSTFNWQPQTGNYTYNFAFQGPLTTNFAPAVLGIGDPYWMPQHVTITGGWDFDPFTGEPTYTPMDASVADMPTSSSSDRLYLPSGTYNLFGVPFDDALVSTGFYSYDPDPDDPYWHAPAALASGSSIAISNINCFYSQTADPILVLTNYYFAPVITPGTGLPGEAPSTEPYPLPVLTGFANTNQTGLMIASVGNPAVIGGWARFAISNGSPTKFAYLGQYFTNAFVVTNGSITTNTTGVLSPYGEFFPTEPGVAALTTLPDIDTGQQGTGIVRVISLNVDANHDGTMDFAYNGPDFVSDAKPFRFWVDDSSDSGDYGGTGIPGQGATGNGILQADGRYAIHGRRDLVNFFPVYLNIGSLFQSTPFGPGISDTDTNYQFVLSQADGALRFDFTQLTPGNYLDSFRTIDEVLAGSIGQTTPVDTITPNGVAIGPAIMRNIVELNYGIILVQAWTNTIQPLVLTIYHGTNQIAQTKLPLSITSVEQMFRHKSLLLTPDSREQADRLTDADVPNEPETNDKNFVFVHGYNVNPDQARGNAADVFKRMYWAGSRAKFYAVTWDGFDSQVLKQVSINLQINIVHALDTAPSFAEFIESLNGPTTVAAHSLGNMVVLSALSDYAAPVTNFFMLDAAAAIESVDGTTPQNTNMIYSEWLPYTNRLYASEWHNLFSNDFRQTLTWRGRFPNLGNTEVYNFYSSGEEVLREWNLDPPTNLLSDAEQIVTDYVLDESPVASFLWVWQEKSKGRAASDGLLSSTHGGWKFNSNYVSLTPAQAALLPDSQLRTNAFFDFGSSSFTGDLALQGNLGNLYAYTYRNRILSDAIPAVSWAIGSHPVTALDLPNEPHNFDMQTSYENQWPEGRGVPHYPTSTTAAGEWHHSDYREIAFTFTYQLYNKLVETGDLK